MHPDDEDLPPAEIVDRNWTERFGQDNIRHQDRWETFDEFIERLNRGDCE